MIWASIMAIIHHVLKSMMEMFLFHGLAAWEYIFGIAEKLC